jgi:uncharacterized protein YegJ (DUF2314 family)
MTFVAKLQAFFTTRTVVAFLLAWIAYHFVNSGIRQNVPAKIVVAGILVVVALGLLLRTRWGLYAAIVAILGLAVNSASQLDPNNLDLWGLFRIFAIGWSGWYLWKQPDERWFGGSDIAVSKADEDDEKPIISLVQLRTSLRFLEAQVLAHALSDAWDLKIVAGDEPPDDADGFVGGHSPHFIVMVTRPHMALFTVHNIEAPYFDDVSDVATKVNNLRFADVIQTHTAWLAVDFMLSSNDKLPVEVAYQMIGKAIAALADDDTIGIFATEHGYFNLWSPELETSLTGPDPLAIFLKEVKAPVIGVPNGDSIEQAITEARRRWPEFATAFQTRQPGDTRFIVKAPFTSEDGDTEHMWLEVFGLEPEYVHGHLINDPFHNKKLKQGSQVEVAVAEISDWLCPDAQDNPKGNFTGRVVDEASKPKSNNAQA